MYNRHIELSWENKIVQAYTKRSPCLKINKSLKTQKDQDKGKGTKCIQVTIKCL